MATSTLSTIRSSLNRKRLRLPPLQRISISFQFHKIVKDVSYRPPGTKLNVVNKVTFSLPEKTSDWKAWADVIKLLKRLEKKMTILVVSHDPKELATPVDHSWRMEMGGFLMEELLSV